VRLAHETAVHPYPDTLVCSLFRHALAIITLDVIAGRGPRGDSLVRQGYQWTPLRGSEAARGQGKRALAYIRCKTVGVDLMDGNRPGSVTVLRPGNVSLLRPAEQVFGDMLFAVKAG
jgi:hypothetical protein